MALTDPLAPPASITLIAPGMGAVLRQSAPGPLAGVDAMTFLAGRGAIRRAWDRHDLDDAQLQPWQRGFLDVLGLDRRKYASAPASAAGSGEATGEGDDYWLHADLVHLAAGLDRLALLPLTGAAAVSNDERAMLAPLIAGHLQDSSLQLRFASSGNWFLHSPRGLDLVTASPDAAAANELNTLMPRGADSAILRRVMTEWQMLLHDHELNGRRQRRGLPAINALWPWGGGSLARVSAAPLPEIFGADDFVRGICLLNAHTARAAPTNGSHLIQQSTRGRAVVAVIPQEDPAALAVDWVEPLIAALRTGRCERLDLVLDEWHIHATRGMLRRFWRKPLPLSAWPQ